MADIDTLLELNLDYIRSLQPSDVQRPEEMLADDVLFSHGP